MAKQTVSRSITLAIRDLEARRTKIDEALETLYGLDLTAENGATGKARLGRPRKMMIFTPKKKRTGRTWTAAQRRAASERMKARFRKLRA